LKGEYRRWRVREGLEALREYASEGAWSCALDGWGEVEVPELYRWVAEDGEGTHEAALGFFARAADPAYLLKLKAQMVVHRFYSGRFGGEASTEGEGEGEGAFSSPGACPTAHKSHSGVDTGRAGGVAPFVLMVSERGVSVEWRSFTRRPPRPRSRYEAPPPVLAPEEVRELEALGVVFNASPEGGAEVEPSSSVAPRPGPERERRDMGPSLRRLAVATWLLEGHVAPTHMLTLTLPPEAWEDLPSDEDRLERWRSALDRFLHALRVRLNRRFGREWGWLWWLEFQKRGAPHLHMLLDLGGLLSVTEWWEWKGWITEAWSRALGVPAPYATKLEALRERDFRYARAYVYGSKKAAQKVLPFPGAWGRTWGVAGTWREALRRERRGLWRDASVYHLDEAALEALIPAIEAVFPSFSEGRDSYTAGVFLRGAQKVLEGRRRKVRVILPPASALGGDLHPLIYAVVEAAGVVLGPPEEAPIAAPLPDPPPPAPPSAPPPPAGAAIGAHPPLRGGWGGGPPPGRWGLRYSVFSIRFSHALRMARRAASSLSALTCSPGEGRSYEPIHPPPSRSFAVRGRP